MSSGFVPAGHSAASPKVSKEKDEWSLAIEGARGVKEIVPSGLQENGKSLYEVLQENKVRIREEAEEKLRLRNQFRSLDDDEASFLDAVLESSKTKEKAVREETKIQLEAFRRLQNETSPDSEVITEQEDGGGTNGKADIRPSSWATSSRKKRKNGPGEVIKGLKFRKASHVADDGSSHSACVDVPENQLRGSASTSGAVVVEEADMLVQNKVDEETSVGSQETKGLLKRPTLLSADYESDSSF